MHPIHPIILSGGSGTRLWPLSRRLYPKQFMDLSGDTLFGQTLRRAMALSSAVPPLVICNDEQRFLAAAILQEHGLLTQDAAKSTILLEPEGRNTAPAIALGALAIRESCEEEDPILLVLSSDHIIEPVEAFSESLCLALRAAEEGGLVVFGVTPSLPETGYGYIRMGKALYPEVHAVERFVEKPDAPAARAMLAEGGYLWNSGIFLFRASVFLEELARYAPAVHEAALGTWETRQPDLDFTRFSQDAFKAFPATSIDYAVMEHTEKAAVAPLKAGWNDMGSWESFYASADKDASGNAVNGDVIVLDSKNCYVHSSHRLVAAIGLEGLSVVETADAVLVLPRDRSQEVKTLLDAMKKSKRQETDTHLRVFRPWGSYEVLAEGNRFQVKRIIVKPGGVLSMQMHHHRAEHWVVVKGTAKVTLGEQELIFKEDQSTYIPLATRHRLENPGLIPLEVIEIQTGSYLGEDDIVRYADTYGRKR
ncbi:mannose-1-phosphate guanylyltransferase/mannose-6-phosphate isomerase [Desulfovibrio sp. OttesenSCG-928-G15]|nr:mannose-1-phosphate guanylyltransferase/mannose-6-phosphate isomerase [Desulfovibrio sp. OttesenSCG-928-G15]